MDGLVVGTIVTGGLFLVLLVVFCVMKRKIVKLDETHPHYQVALLKRKTAE